MSTENENVEVEEITGKEEPSRADGFTGTTVPDEADERLRGEVESAHGETESDAVPGEPKVSIPSFFVEDEMHRVEVDILASPDTGAIKSVSRKGMGFDLSKFPHLIKSEEWFEFTTPTYEQLSLYRQRSSTFAKEVNQRVVDKIALRNYFIVWHLKGWSLRDASGNPIPIETEDTGALTDASLKMVYSMQPVLLDVILTIFEKDIMLS